MSSDKSDYPQDLQGKRYTITPPVWRAPELRNVMNTLDYIHDLERWVSLKNDGRGQQVRRRIQGQGDRLSNRGKARSGLPRNLYRATWLEEKSKIYLEDVLKPEAVVNIPYDKLNA
jgi:hypothetical protein